MKRTVWGPESERIGVVPLKEQLEFQGIVQSETTPEGRRMLDWWATPEDMDLDSDRKLDATFKLLWRTPADPE